MAKLRVGLLAIAAAVTSVALGACGGGSRPTVDLPATTAVLHSSAPGPLERGKWVCTSRSARRACSGPVTVGVRYLYVLRTHCGILSGYFAGRLWRANPPLSDGSGNPPRGWDNPEALGTMRLVSIDLAEFRQNKELVARFTPAPPHWRSVFCE